MGWKETRVHDERMKFILEVEAAERHLHHWAIALGNGEEARRRSHELGEPDVVHRHDLER